MGGVIGEISGANQRQARAAGRAAQAQEAQAQENLAFARESRDEAVGAARGTPEEIRRFEAGLASQEANIGREEALLGAIDPALIEASGQVLKLLRGEEASVIDPVRKNRQRQRQKLLDSLREQFGPGAESSSAGVQALTAFDAETSNVIANAQQSSIGQLFGATSSLLPSVSNSRGQAASRLQSAIGGRQQQLSSAFLGGGQLALQAGQGAQQAAGSRFVQDQLRGQQIQGIGSDIFQGALTLGSAGLAGGSSLGSLFGGGGSTALAAGTSGASQFGSPTSQSLQGLFR